jgi:hypothetical protein
MQSHFDQIIYTYHVKKVVLHQAPYFNYFLDPGPAPQPLNTATPFRRSLILRARSIPLLAALCSIDGQKGHPPHWGDEQRRKP